MIIIAFIINLLILKEKKKNSFIFDMRIAQYDKYNEWKMLTPTFP